MQIHSAVFACIVVLVLWLVARKFDVLGRIYTQLLFRYAPLAGFCEDAEAQGIKVPEAKILRGNPPDGDGSIQGRLRYAGFLRKQYGVKKLSYQERRAFNASRPDVKKLRVLR